jgi:hypothetical protein
MSPMEANTHPTEQIVARLTAGMQHDRATRDGLDMVLSVTLARATGLWRISPGPLVCPSLTDAERDQQSPTSGGSSSANLSLVGFRGVIDMAETVKEDFASATQTVPLTDTSLGIVKAAVTHEPAIATLENVDGTLGGSATWLARFGAIHSLAVPIQNEREVFGVLAISTAEPLDRQTTWQVMLEIAEGLAVAMSSLSDA